MHPRVGGACDKEIAKLLALMDLLLRVLAQVPHLVH